MSTKQKKKNTLCVSLSQISDCIFAVPIPTEACESITFTLPGRETWYYDSSYDLSESSITPGDYTIPRPVSDYPILLHKEGSTFLECPTSDNAPRVLRIYACERGSFTYNYLATDAPHQITITCGLDSVGVFGAPEGLALRLIDCLNRELTTE